MSKNTVAIIGTGPAGLMAGTVLAQNGWEVVFFDQKKAPARKFLVAGSGGFNLTNNEELDSFLKHYNHTIIQEAVRQFTNLDFIRFLEIIGVQTFVGSSGKIFPIKGLKPIDVLNKWLEYLKNLGVEFKMACLLNDFTNKEIYLIINKDKIEASFSKVIFALGGASWKKTGSDGKWLELFKSKGINCIPLESSNSGIVCKNWKQMLTFDGQYNKNCKVYSNEIEKQGDVLLTMYGLEGPPIYALNSKWRKGKIVYMDFKPSLSERQIMEKIQDAKNPTDGLKQLKLSKPSIYLLKKYLSKEEFMDPKVLTNKIKAFELPFENFRPIDEVISTVGGIDMNEISNSFELKKFPGFYCVGEMLDWDAPTGGYLIQACVSTGYVAGKNIVNQS